MNFLEELHKKATSEASAYKDKVIADFNSSFKIAQRNNIYDSVSEKDSRKVSLYHLGSTKDAYNLYYDKNSH